MHNCPEIYGLRLLHEEQNSLQLLGKKKGKATYQKINKWSAWPCKCLKTNTNPFVKVWSCLLQNNYPTECFYQWHPGFLNHSMNIKLQSDLDRASRERLPPIQVKKMWSDEANCLYTFNFEFNVCWMIFWIWTYARRILLVWICTQLKSTAWVLLTT